jgi:LPS export ABC transporter protein LptC
MKKILCFTLFISLSLPITASAKAKKGAAAKKETTVESADEKVTTFSLVGYSETGDKKWQVEGQSANIMEKKVDLSKVVAKIFGQDTQMTVWADRGSLNRSTNDVHLEQNVLAKTNDGAQLITDYIDYSSVNSSMNTEAPVYVERGTLKTNSIGASGQPNLKKVQFKKDVTVTIDTSQKMQLAQNAETGENKTETPQEPEKAQTQTGAEMIFPLKTDSKAPAAPMIITCDGPLEIDYAKNLAIFNKNVKVNDSRGKIFSDVMEVYFDTKTQTVKEVIATGNVEIHQAENSSYSDKAIYRAIDGRITLLGSPKLVIYSSGELSSLMNKEKKPKEPEGEKEQLAPQPPPQQEGS